MISHTYESARKMYASELSHLKVESRKATLYMIEGKVITVNKDRLPKYGVEVDKGLASDITARNSAATLATPTAASAAAAAEAQAAAAAEALATPTAAAEALAAALAEALATPTAAAEALATPTAAALAAALATPTAAAATLAAPTAAELATALADTRAAVAREAAVEAMRKASATEEVARVAEAERDAMAEAAAANKTASSVEVTVMVAHDCEFMQLIIATNLATAEAALAVNTAATLVEVAAKAAATAKSNILATIDATCTAVNEEGNAMQIYIEVNSDNINRLNSLLLSSSATFDDVVDSMIIISHGRIDLQNIIAKANVDKRMIDELDGKYSHIDERALRHTAMLLTASSTSSTSTSTSSSSSSSSASNKRRYSS